MSCHLASLTALVTGGFLTASCPHKIIYAVKPLVRAESVRDHVDVVLSLAHVPTITINDMPNMTARHGNCRIPELFSPHEGRLAEATEETLQAVRQGSFVRNLPCLEQINNAGAELVDHGYSSSAREHPVTRTDDKYCLADNFHKKNMSCEVDLLRDPNLVPQLKGLVNTQAEEQNSIYRSVARDLYYLDVMSPGNYLFVLRLKLHLLNMDIATRQIVQCIRIVHYNKLGVKLHLLFSMPNLVLLV